MFQLMRRHPAWTTAIAGGLAAAGFALHAMAAGEPGTDRIKESLQKMLGGRAEVKSVTKSPVPGLFEVNVGGQVVYTDATGRYVINGELIDTKTGTNLTEERLADLNRIKWSDLPLARASNGPRVTAAARSPCFPTRTAATASVSSRPSSRWTTSRSTPSCIPCCRPIRKSRRSRSGARPTGPRRGATGC